jgi:transcriptional regulator with XRE-family HTH domain
VKERGKEQIVRNDGRFACGMVFFRHQAAFYGRLVYGRFRFLSRESGAAFFVFDTLFKNRSRFFLLLLINTLFVLFFASGLYLFFMKKKKPGPPKGQKHTDVKRSAFGERLYRARKAKGLSQEELGQKVGLSKRMISRYEGTYPGPSLEILEDIAKALNVTASYLLGESVFKKIEDDIKPLYRQHIENLQKLPPSKQKHAIEMVEAWASKNEPDKE